MKKHLIGLAAVAVTGVACAQSTVTLFGAVDATFQRGSGSISNKNQLGNGGLTTPRIGFRGTEDLGGGMSASFWLEAGLQNDNGAGTASNTNNQGSGAPAASLAGGQGLTFSRRSTVSLAGSWGEVRLGRDYTPQYWNLVFDPFGNVGVGASVTFTNIITGPTAVRASNTIGYLLPSGLGGLYGQVAHYRGENNSGTPTSDDGTGTGIRLGYATGPFEIAVAASKTAYSTGDAKQNNVGGSWDFGMAKLQMHYSKTALGNRDAKGYLIGGTAPFGNGIFKLAFSRHETDAAGTPSSKKLALGYVHNLSKRTAVYATYARVRNSGGATTALNGAVTVANESSSGIDVGIRHNF